MIREMCRTDISDKCHITVEYNLRILDLLQQSISRQKTNKRKSLQLSPLTSDTKSIKQTAHLVTAVQKDSLHYTSLLLS